MTCNIYKLTCNDPKLIYYGSTTTTLKKRLNGHKTNYTTGDKKYTSRKLFEVGNVKIHLLEECKIEDGLKRERHYIENNDCVNKQIPLRKKEEYKEIRRDYMKEYNKNYRINNQQKLKEMDKEKYQRNKADRLTKILCECGASVCKDNLIRHKKTKKHQSNLNLPNTLTI